MEGCCGSMIKYVIFFVNFLIFLGGLVAMGLGIFALVDGEALKDFINMIDANVTIDIFGLAAFLIIFVSLLVAGIAFFGCCGAIKENKCLLGVYMVILVCLFAGMIAGAVVAGQYNGIEVIKKPMMDSLSQYDPSALDQHLEQSWDGVQDSFKCCGVDTFSDWEKNNTHFPTTPDGFKVPVSCCSTKHGISEDDLVNCQKNPGQFSNQMPGCYAEFDQFIKDHEQTILAVVGSTIGLLVLSFFLTFYMFCNINKY